MKKLRTFACLALAASPLIWSAAHAADSKPDTRADDRQPSTDTPTPQQQQPQRRRFFEGQPPTPEQIREAEAFAEKYSPNRYQAFKRFAESNPNPDGREWIKRSIVRGFIEMQAIDREDHDLYEMKLEELRLDDQIFGAVAEYRKRTQSGEKVNRTDLRDEIRPQFKELLALRRKEAEHRIERMQLAIKDEQAKLDKLKRVSDEGINARLEQEIDSGGVFRPGGFGPPAGGAFANPQRIRDASPPPSTAP